MALNKELLKKHLDNWSKRIEARSDQTLADQKERNERVTFFQSFTPEKMQIMSAEDIYEYVSHLWAMRIWGNKHYVVDSLLEKHTVEEVRTNMKELIWGEGVLAERWDKFRAAISGLGPAMMSEMLCFAHPDKYLLWNRRAYAALHSLGIENLPKHNYQMTGERYTALCAIGKFIADEMKAFGILNVDMLRLDYFIWDELQTEESLNKIQSKGTQKELEEDVPKSDVATEFLHEEVKNKLADIGTWLGFKADTEVKVADGSKVDTVWEATIGNMGRVIYVFEVQTKGSIDSLIINLLKSMNNPAVQGVVAVSDEQQLEKIRKHALGVKPLHDKLRYWDYKQVLEVHDSLEGVNEAINGLGLVPQGF